MGLLQIAVIWGVATAALFPSPVRSGEWESYQDLKEAIVRSKSKRDVLLPFWVNSLDYQRPYYFWDVPSEKKRGGVNVNSPVINSHVVNGDVVDISRGNTERNP